MILNIFKYLKLGLNISRENYEKMMFCKRHNDYGEGSFQYDNDPDIEELDGYYDCIRIARQYESELPEKLRWYLYQRSSLWPRKFNIIN